MAEWTKERSGPVALFDDEPPRAGWVQILLLAERLTARPTLLPTEPLDRAYAFGLAHEIFGEQGLVWTRRLQAVHAGLEHEPGGFPEPVAHYLADKYGYRADEASSHPGRVIELLGMLAGRLLEQRERGSRFYLGESLAAVDIYSATAMTMFDPLPPEQYPMLEQIRSTLEFLDEPTAEALDPILLEHRDFVYDEFLELPSHSDRCR